MNLHYLWWPITVVFLSSVHAYASFLNKGNTGWKPLLTVWGVGFLLSPFWPIISRNSKNLLFDGLLYDTLLFLTYAITFMYVEQHHLNFKLTNYLGIVIVMVGLYLIKQ
jgi:hypothetical protein